MPNDSETPTKRRILFVDDEQNVLDGLRRSLFKRRKVWDMHFANSGEAALEVLASGNFDAIVTDMRMPGIDGAQLLVKVREMHPDTIRIVLSGQCDEESALRTVPTAHQFLSKPCDTSLLREMLERDFALRGLFEDDRLRSAAGQIDALPIDPTTFNELRRLLEDSETSIGQVAELIERDVSISTKILQLSNSSFFGLPQNITELKVAVSYLGLQTIQSITLVDSIFRPFEGATVIGCFSFEAMQTHAYQTARCAKSLCSDPLLADEAFLGGLVQNIGKLVLVSQRADDFEKVMAKVAETGRPMHEIERDLFGIDHGQLGAYLLGIWNLPTRVVESVAYCHQPSEVEHEEFSVLTAVHIADVLIHQALHESTEGDSEPPPQLDEAYLERFDLAEKIDEWRDLVAAQLADESATE